ncbi:MAG: ABC transporter ATP-binding protein [Lachnospiraceae bacterium]|nr:ABC transporter ATP-binding protein [Lachnospiraceae bacterium]
MENIIELKNIGYSYHSLQGETVALKDISFGVKKGEFLAVVGPSGCGKSTLLSIIAGLLAPEEGTITVNNPDGSLRYPRIGYMLQHDHLFEWRTIYQNVILGLEINHMMTEERIAYVNQLLKDYNLEKFRNKRPSELSGGMKQRAALIRTLALEPQLLLLDEPFSALDYQTRLFVSADICNLIRAAGKTMLIITHDLSEAISLADRIIILSRRPAVVKQEIPIRLTLPDDSPLASRNAPEFQYYFNLLWKELSEDEGQEA